MAARPAPADGVRAVDRALALLNAFQDEDRALGLAEISRRVGLNMTTALRLLQTLEAQGFIQRLPSGGICLVRRCCCWANASGAACG